MSSSIDNPHSTILTLYDAISDSPVYRSTAIHFDDQVDLLEKWLDLLSKYMKQYVDKLNRFNLETNTLCKKVIPAGIDDFMIDPNFTGSVIKSFSDALEASLAFKTKLVSDLEETFIQPIQLFIKTHLKEFKDFRKQHEKLLEKYEAQLSKFSSQSKSKEASAVREEAFRVYEARKSYVQMSSQHAIRILGFRSMVEHFLVERFSLATASHLKEFEGDSKSWLVLKDHLVSWNQWLLDDTETCNYQLNRLQHCRLKLETKILTKARPVRDLEIYNMNQSQTSLNNRHSLDFSNVTLFNPTTNQPSYKWGYLFVRGTRNYWSRRWFFLYDGSFGFCNVNTSPKFKGTISLVDRVSVLLCDIKPIFDIDRRHCFEVISAQQPTFILQAETAVEMHDWIASFEKSKRLMLQSESSKSNPADTSTLLNPLRLTEEVSPEMLDSLTPLLVGEVTRVNPPADLTVQSLDVADPSSHWGVPWALVPHRVHQAHVGLDEMPPLPSAPTTLHTSDMDGHPLVWPTRSNDDAIPNVDLLRYPPALENRNKELRHLFAGVDPDEIVLFAFTGLLKKKPYVNDKKEIDTPESSDMEVVEEQELIYQVSTDEEPRSSYGYGYSGRAFVTQNTFWFYSCILMHCVNTVAVPLKDIKTVRLIRDHTTLLLVLDHHPDPFIFSADDIESLAEKLKSLIFKAKQKEREPLQTTLDGLYPMTRPILHTSFTDPTGLRPASSRSTDVLSKPQRKQSAPLKLAAAALMAASVAGGTGLIEAKKDVSLDFFQTLSRKPSQEPVEDIPLGPVSCGCKDHLDRLETDIELPFSARQLYYMMFDEFNPNAKDFWEKKTIENKNKGLVMTEWKTEEGKKERTLKYIKSVYNPMATIKEAEVIEKQVVEQKEDDIRYTILTSTKTSQHPYADFFTPYIKYCITRTSPNRARLRCYIGIKYQKNILAKDQITKSAMKEMSENVRVLKGLLSCPGRMERGMWRWGIGLVLIWLLIQYSTSQPSQPEVISRAVYLKDINEGLIDTYAAYDQHSERAFLESKRNHQPMFSLHHHQFSNELLFSRERLAMLRHTTLVLFQLVNEVDAQLLENEYTNWLMDTRLQCRSPNVDYIALHCDEVKRQLENFPIGTLLKQPK